MLLVLLAVLPARADWVEIAQNGYRRSSLRRPIAAEFAPDYGTYGNYPNATLGADWRRGHVDRVADVRAPAAHKQEYYDIDGPGQGDRLLGQGRPAGGGPRRGTDRGESAPPERDEGEDTRGPFTKRDPVKGQTGSASSENDSQRAGSTNESERTTGQHGDRGTAPGPLDRGDLFSLDRVMQRPEHPTPGKLNGAGQTDATAAKHVQANLKSTATQTEIPEHSSEEPARPTLHLTDRDDESLPGIWKILKTIANIISKNTQRGVSSKIKYLEDLKRTLLYNIQERIDAVWPAGAAGEARAARGAEARGHMEKPSSEGALMTISFLTFAVFLIKLVLQIIHTYKNKTMMMTPAVVTAVGRAAAAARNAARTAAPTEL